MTVLTGLLYAAVVAMWAVVLLPRWLGTSDRYRDARTSQRFRRSLRSVSLRHRSHDVAAEPGGGSSRVDTAPKDSAIDRHLDLGIDPFVGSAEDGHRRRARHQQVREQARAHAVTKRRRILVGLAAATTVSLAAAIVGVVPLALAVPPVAALGGYAFLLRAHSKRRRGRATSRGRDDLRPASRPTDEARGDQKWQPVASPEPSYMRAPRATAVPRELDSTKNGPWTAERMLEQAAALRTGQDEVAELGLDEYAYPSGYETARAVNE